MFYGIDLGNEGKERHAQLLNEAQEWRLAQRVTAQTPRLTQWSSTLLIWFGKQLIGWGRQIQRAT